MNKIKSLFSKGVNKIKNAFSYAETAVNVRAHQVLDGTRAEAYVDTGVKILIAVVIGALLMAGLYALFNSTVMPKVTEKVNELFNYNGG